MTVLDRLRAAGQSARRSAPDCRPDRTRGLRRLRKADLIDAILGERKGLSRTRTPVTATATVRRLSVAHVRVALRARAARPPRRSPPRARMSSRSNLPQRSLRPLGAPKGHRAHKGAKAGARALSARSPRMASALPREWLRSWATAPPSCGCCRQSRPTAMSTSRPLRCAAASWVSGDRVGERAGTHAASARSAIPHLSGSTRSTASRRTRWPRAHVMTISRSPYPSERLAFDCKNTNPVVEGRSSG